MTINLHFGKKRLTSISPARMFNPAVLQRKLRVDSVALILLTILGPFGTYEAFDWPIRAVYWTVVIIGCGVIFEIVVPTILYHAKLSRMLPLWARFLVSVLGGSFIAVWVVFTVETVARGPMSLAILPWLFVYVATIGSVICFVSFMPHFIQTKKVYRDPDIDFERIAFFNTYPNLKGARIKWITMEDHYARVVLDDTELSLHASMRDLEKQLENYPGLRVHRSHWVSHAQIQGIERNGRKFLIKVADDTRLPLGNSYRNQVERILSEQDKLHGVRS